MKKANNYYNKINNNNKVFLIKKQTQEFIKLIIIKVKIL